eukprot:TRINITY_DN19941_c0_g1_i1.p1 TRINITY_DN19941_c0_g1~~TRINITY_DN19941_c0_g1_i1.p1  ORF type:complete len:642 (+),score=141.20 TRINITY_DN19941_c0_g1_i1:72-1997(+)
MEDRLAEWEANDEYCMVEEEELRFSLGMGGKHVDPMGGGSSVRSGGSRIGTKEWLANETNRRKLALRELQKREEDKVSEDCTFKPKINKVTTMKRQHLPTFERLSASRQMEYEKREELRRRKEDEANSEFTFKPEISKMTKTYASQKRRHTVGQMETLGDKLYSDAKLMEQKHRVRVKEEARNELEGLFKPKISSTVSPRRPLHERLDEIKKEKSAKLHDLRQKWFHEEELTFKPSICARSRSVQTPQTSGAHLLHPSRDASQCSSPSRTSPAYHREEIKGKPSISNRSRLLATTSDEYRQHTDFVERQCYLGKRRDTELHMKRLEYEAENGPKQPRPRSQHDIDTAINNMMQRSRVGQEKIKCLRDESVAGLFKPHVCRREREGMGASRPPKEIIIERIKHEMEERQNKEITLKPKINEHSRKLAAARRSNSYSGPQTTPYGKNTEVLESARRKRMQELKVEEEECTFQPVTNGGKVPVVNYDSDVSGMQQFLLRQEQARRKEADRKRREAELCQVKPSAISSVKRRDECGRLHTVPKPFKLSESRHPPPARESYTFHPHTNEAKRDDLLRRVLEEINENTPSRDRSHSILSHHTHVSERDVAAMMFEEHVSEPPIDKASSHSHLFGPGSDAHFMASDFG